MRGRALVGHGVRRCTLPISGLGVGARAPRLVAAASAVRSRDHTRQRAGEGEGHGLQATRSAGCPRLGHSVAPLVRGHPVSPLRVGTPTGGSTDAVENGSHLRAHLLWLSPSRAQAPQGPHHRPAAPVPRRPSNETARPGFRGFTESPLRSRSPEIMSLGLCCRAAGWLALLRRTGSPRVTSAKRLEPPRCPARGCAEVGHTGGVLSLTPARPAPSSGRSLELPRSPAFGHCFLKSAVLNSDDAIWLRPFV